MLPSTLEGLSITLLEGMSYGRCCLVSDIPPNVEAAGRHARAVSAAAMPATWRGQLAALLDDPGRAARLGQRGQVHAIEHYSWDRVAARRRTCTGKSWTEGAEEWAENPI